MKFSFNLVFQIAAIIVSLGTVLSGIVPASWQPAIIAVVTIAQSIVALGAHQVNPDGTPASRAYMKD